MKGDHFLTLIKEVTSITNFQSNIAAIKCDWIIQEV